jgi:uncharacterized protein
MVEMIVYGVALDEESQVPVLVLKDRDEKSVLPIWIGAMEAMAISLALNGVKLPRPMTHDLLLSTINALDAKVLSVNVVSIKDGTYYAEVEVDQKGERKRIDCRPSDGIALALRAEAPITVDESVLASAEAERKPEHKAVLQTDDAKQWNELLEKLNVDVKYKM